MRKWELFQVLKTGAYVKPEARLMMQPEEEIEGLSIIGINIQEVNK